MTVPQTTHRAAPPGEQLANWLALLALLALGIVSPFADPAPAAPRAHPHLDTLAGAPPLAARSSVPCTR